MALDFSVDGCALPRLHSLLLIVQQLRQYGNLELAVSVLHLLEQIGQLAQPDLAIHEVVRRYFATSNRVQSFANETWCVVKCGLDRNFRVVKQRRFKFHLGSARTTPKQIDCSTASNEPRRPLPRRRRTHGLNDYIGSKLPVC